MITIVVSLLRASMGRVSNMTNAEFAAIYSQAIDHMLATHKPGHNTKEGENETHLRLPANFMRDWCIASDKENNNVE